jgi:hypothetical protein
MGLVEKRWDEDETGEEGGQKRERRGKGELVGGAHSEREESLCGQEHQGGPHGTARLDKPRYEAVAAQAQGTDSSDSASL